jgi:hypothetical protein
VGRIGIFNTAATQPIHRGKRTALACVVCIFALAAGAATAGAATIESFTSGTSTSQSGAHSNLNVSFSFGESETVKALELKVPEGLSINPTVVPRCAAATFADFECPSSSQIGLITTHTKPAGEPTRLLGTAPIYEISPEADETARLGFVLPTVDLPVEVPVAVRADSDYGLSFLAQNLPQAVPLAGANLTLWAAPESPSHDSERFAKGTPSEPAGCPGIEGTSCIVTPDPSSLRSLALLQNPTTCSGMPTSDLSVDTYQHPSEILTAAATAQAMTGCNLNAFEPALSWKLSTAQTSTSSGLSVDLRSQQSLNPGEIAPAEIEDVTLTLPPELAIDPEATAAQGICTDAQFELGSQAPETCPTESEVGSFAIAPVGFEAPLEGTVYFGTPEPDGTLRLLMTALGSGIDAKFIGLLQPDNGSGKVDILLSDLPQLPLEELKLNLSSDPGLLVTPARCGLKTAAATVTPWDPLQRTALLTDSALLNSVGPDGGPCPGPATQVGVSLSPTSIAADGSSTSLATATVTDSGGIVVPGEEIAFSSTDPAEQIGPVTDHSEGTYTTRITASRATGARTITATDLSAGSGVLGTATLTQIAVGTPPVLTIAAPPAGRPTVTITKKPSRLTHDRTPTFRFTSNEPEASFSCLVDAGPFRACVSPTTLAKLGLGGHIFSLRTTGSGGDSQPVTYNFKVRAASRPRHHSLRG